MDSYDKVRGALREQRRRWLIAGVAGFIGSSLLETLLRLDQDVVGLDNFLTGHHRNLQQVRELFAAIRDELAVDLPQLADREPVYRDFRAGDVRHSQADVSKAERLLGYRPTHRIHEGLRGAMSWYVADLLGPAA